MPTIDIGFLTFPVPALIAVIGIIAAVIIASRLNRPRIIDRRPDTPRTDKQKD
ncbi:hypothetical protein ACIHFD_49300 [Nonomuraea sp. NPDC051941]|uniref:hypothetical protein n=1 Tax=Nonomuraea sp. NPDC051941 TaxID=3364373 RepID=UPI0037CA9C74